MSSKGQHKKEINGKPMEKAKQKNKFDFETLVLLIGTNPLPNLVVAEYFIKNNKNLKKIFMVHSKENIYQEATKTQAKNLGKVIEGKFNESRILKFSLVRIKLSNVADASQIFRDLHESLDSQLKGINSIHLNYTGGTKVMGVHIYKFIENEFKGIEKSFSYFDGRSFKIFDDNYGKYTSNDLREESGITFDDIIKLHGFERKEKKEKKEIDMFSSSLEQIKKLFSEGKFDEFNNSIINFYEQYLLLKKVWEKSTQQAVKIGEILGMDKYRNGPLYPVIREMPPKFRFFDEKGCFDYTRLCKNDKEDNDFVNFLNRIWLEYYVYHLLHNDLDEPNTRADWNWKINKEGWKHYFQIDVILKKGFQLVGISCTATLDRGMCKQKGFEIIHRTRQIGGDESKAVLVTLLDVDKANNLEEELKKDSGCLEGFFKVFAKSQLKKNDFINEFKTFLQLQ